MAQPKCEFLSAPKTLWTDLSSVRYSFTTAGQAPPQYFCLIVDCSTKFTNVVVPMPQLWNG